MAIGDVVAWISSIVGGAEITIQPNGEIEWIIHNIYHEAEANLRLVEDPNELLFDTSNAKGSWSAYWFHLTNTHYLTVENTNASAKLIGFDGIVSKA